MKLTQSVEMAPANVEKICFQKLCVPVKNIENFTIAKNSNNKIFTKNSDTHEH